MDFDKLSSLMEFAKSGDNEDIPKENSNRELIRAILPQLPQRYHMPLVTYLLALESQNIMRETNGEPERSVDRVQLLKSMRPHLGGKSRQRADKLLKLLEMKELMETLNSYKN